MEDTLQRATQFVRGIFGGNYPTASVKSSVDGKYYKVRDMPDKQQAADLLARVRMKLVRLCDTLEQKYPDRPQVKQMKRNFNADPNRFLEATPDAQHTSYSVNKGESVHLCLRQIAHLFQNKSNHTID